MKQLVFLRCVLAAVFALAIAAVSPAWAQAPFDPPGLDRAMAAKNFHVDRLMATDGVVGVGVGRTPGGQAAVVIMTEAAGVGGLHRSLDGVPVVIWVTGAFNAINRPDANGNHDHGTVEDPPPDPSADPCDSDPTAQCGTPVPIGVSTGNATSCSAGTIGFRVADDRDVYSLSNNHVYALSNAAELGDDIVQPGSYDTNCNVEGSTGIGTLAEYEPFDLRSCLNGGHNTIDAAIALSSEGLLGNATPLDGYGTPSSFTVPATIGLDVQKYGRTTGLTMGTVTTINATVNVGYSAGTACFQDQIIVESSKGAFIKSGDSGSGLVTDDDGITNQNPVGLLFAGSRSGKVAIANPIDYVLDEFFVAVDGL